MNKDHSSSVSSASPPSSTEAIQPPKRSGLATASLVLGILGIFPCGVFGVIGLPIGIVAMVKIGRSNGRLGGNGLAIAGISCSTVALAALVVQMILVGLLLPSLDVARTAAMQAKALAQARQLATAATLYATDHNDRFPSANDWVQVLTDMGAINEQILISPFATEDGRAFAMNAKLGEIRVADIADPAHTVLFFECAAKSPPAGGPELFPTQPRSASGYVVVFANGEATVTLAEEIDLLLWDP
jgi:hypothetical protein